jgi:ribosome-binding ATPase YchF (GTP1/OBG family)
MKIGIIGYQGSGKSTLFEWLTGEPADPALAHATQSAMATIVDPRVVELQKIYQPKKTTQAALELTDTPGLSRTHEGSANKLAQIREVGCLVVVIAAYGGNDALADLRNLDDDLLIADLDIVTGRIERLREQVKKPRPNRDELKKELEALEPLPQEMEDGKHLRDMELSADQQNATRAFQLFSEKPRIVIFNVADDEQEDTQRWTVQAPDNAQAVAVSLSLQLELVRMPESEREEFCREMGVSLFDRNTLLHQIMDVSGQMIFFTTGDREVRTWMIRKGATAVDAAGLVHTDLAKGFIRAEVMTCDDLIRVGSEREIKAQHLLRHEHKDYVVQQGEILLIRHN